MEVIKITHTHTHTHTLKRIENLMTATMY